MKQENWLSDIITDLSISNLRGLTCPLPGITSQKEILDLFVKCMALCHECLIEERENSIGYIGQSPDEITLVEVAMRVGVKYAKNIGGIITLELLQNNETIFMQYEKICIFEFDSNRKRNSIIVKDLSKNKYFLFIKGADDIITKRASNVSESYLEKVS